MTADDFTHEGYFYQMGVPPVRVGIMMSIPGLDFEEAWQQREVVDFEDVMVSFISKSHLIISKRVAGRPQDLLDAVTLENSEE